MSEIVAEKTNTAEGGGSTPQVKKSRKGVYIAIGIFSLIFQLALFFAYSFGLVHAFERTLTPLSAVEFILEIFLIRWVKAQQYLVGTAVGVIYLVFFVMQIIKFISSCKSCHRMLHGSDKTVKPCAASVRLNAIYAFQQVMICSVIASSLSGAGYSGWIALFMVLFVLLFSLPLSTQKTAASASDKALNFIGNVLVGTILCLLYLICAEPAGEKALSGLGMLFGGYIVFDFGFKSFLSSFFCNLIEPAMNIAMIVIIVKMANEVFAAYYDKVMLKALQRSWIYSLVILGLQFILRTFLSFNSQYVSLNMLKEWIVAVGTFDLPAFLLLFALWLILRYTNLER